MSSFFREMFDGDYLDYPWRQRHVDIIRSMHNYCDVHDHQKIFDDHAVLFAFQVPFMCLYVSLNTPRNIPY